MGKYIDRVLWLSLAALASFFFFYNCLGGVWIPLLLSVLLLLCAWRIFSAPWKYVHKRKSERQRARKIVASWPYRPASHGEREARQIITASLGPIPEDVRVVFLPFHPSKSLGVEDILARHREADARTLIISACPAQSAAFAAAEACTAPSIQLLDRNRMLRLARRAALPEPPGDISRPRLHLNPLLYKLRPTRCLSMAILMLVGYVFTGLWTYLLSAAMLFLFCSLRMRQYGCRKNDSLFFR